MRPVTAREDERLVAVLDAARAEYRATGAVDIRAWQQRCPERARDLPALLRTLVALERAAAAWKTG